MNLIDKEETVIWFAKNHCGGNTVADWETAKSAFSV
jgi:hypothetical protein